MISVIIPAYMARKFLPACLESIGQQSLQPAEVLVIDDASPEPIDDIIEEFENREGYPPIRLIKHEVNRGQAAGRNTGMKASKGDWLAFIDCDDMWAPRHLESLLATLDQTHADLGFCPAILFTNDPHDPSNYILRPQNADEEAIRPLALVNRCFIITSSTVIRASALENIGGFDEREEIRGVEDLDCFMRLLKAGHTFCMASDPTLYYRKHPASATGVLGHLARQDVRVRSSHVKWVSGGFYEKREILLNTYWRAANQLWAINAVDRWKWLLLAIISSIPSPCMGTRRACRFIMNLYSKRRAK